MVMNVKQPDLNAACGRSCHIRMRTTLRAHAQRVPSAKRNFGWMPCDYFVFFDQTPHLRPHPHFSLLPASTFQHCVLECFLWAPRSVARVIVSDRVFH